MKSIAIVDDNEDNLFVLQGLLEDYYQIFPFTNGLDALKGIKENPPSLVLLDISLPGMDGPEILKHIRG